MLTIRLQVAKGSTCMVDGLTLFFFHDAVLLFGECVGGSCTLPTMWAVQLAVPRWSALHPSNKDGGKSASVSAQGLKLQKRKIFCRFCFES